MRQSNAYVLIFSLILTIILGGLLSLTSEGLKPLQDKQVELDTKKKILGAVMDISSIEKPEQIFAVYDNRVESLVVNHQGEQIKVNAEGDSVNAEDVNIRKNHKRSWDKKVYPVFKFVNESNPDKVEAYIFPMFGSGLWDWINGYLALEGDLNTIKGIAFDHKAETPGLGARITSAEIQERYIGKKLFSDQGNFVSVSMVKGEKGEPLDPHHVDGMSGATLTGNGVNTMISSYMEHYLPYFEKVKNKNRMAFNID